MAVTPCEKEAYSVAAPPFDCAEADRPWILAATILGSSAAFLSASVVTVALPAIQADLSATVGEVQWVINGYALMLGALILVGGAAGDIFGRRLVFILGLGITTAATILCGLAPNTGLLIAGRIAQGLGGALLIPTSLAILSIAYPEARRGRAIGTWSAATAMATALGPPIGGWLVDTISWRPVFSMQLPFLIAPIAIALWRMPESKDYSRQAGIDWPGAFLATLGLGGLTYGLVSSTELGWTHPVVAGSLGLGGAALLAFVVVEARARAPMMPLDVFSSRAFTGANLFTLFLYFTVYGLFFFLPFNLIQVQGYSAALTGATFIPFNVLMALLSPWAGGLRDRYGSRLPLVVGALIVAASFVLFAITGVGGSYWTTFFPAMIVLGLGMAITVAPLTALVMSSVAPERIGAASGINNAVSRIASLLAVAILGVVMLQVFSGALAAQVQQMGLPPALAQGIMTQTQSLADLKPPAGASAEQVAVIEDAVNVSFIAGFRVLMWLSAGLAVLSAICAALIAEPRPEQEESPVA